MSLEGYKPLNDYKEHTREGVLKNVEDLLEQAKEAKIDSMHKPVSAIKDLKDNLDTYHKLSTTVGDKKIVIDVIKNFLNSIEF